MQTTTGLKIANIAYWLLLSLWFGSLVTIGVTAAIAFPTMKGLDPALPTYAAYQGEHWQIAAGRIMAQVFFVGDGIQLIALCGVSLITGLHLTVFRQPLNRPANAIRTLLVVVLLGTVAYHTLLLAPRMNANLQLYWSQAELAGEWEAPKAAFDADHKRAERIMGLNALLLVALVAASAAALTGGGPGREPEETPGGLEEPALLRRRG